eukprot:TRINITY_DN2933_c0_g1_i1.p1 TRINITY_DN2933_c0_g1~~TRINITY_DN2933_c0_g1_i1.p1  ORF type:complete len:136 (-),score=12.52 TRINITY_DN2933_c0_g1_i1:88-495(-)
MKKKVVSPGKTLFARFARLISNWPSVPGRESRALKFYLRDHVKTRFFEAQTETNPEKLTSLISDGLKDLKALERLRNNTYSKQYVLQHDTTPPPMVRNADILLSDESQKKFEKANFTLRDRIKFTRLIIKSGKMH